METLMRVSTFYCIKACLYGFLILYILELIFLVFDRTSVYILLSVYTIAELGIAKWSIVMLDDAGKLITFF